MLGFIYSAAAGALMSIQGVMNTRLGEKMGFYEANALVQATAFLLSLIVMWIWGSGSLSAIKNVHWFYWLGGVFGIAITLTVMLGINKLSPTVAISVILISQLLVAAIIDCFGLMGSEKIAFSWNKYVGLAMMIGGVLLFK